MEILFGVMYVLAFGVSLWSLGQLKAFLAATPSIADGAGLERYKELARLQMYLALAMIVLMGVGLLAGIVVVVRHGLPGLGLVLGVNAVVLGVGLHHKKVEGRVRGLPAAEALRDEYRRVSETWVKKPLPDF
jgi:hypothetical protein